MQIENERQKSGSLFRNIFDRFIKIRGTPRQIALGLALGLFLGFSPTMGFQIIPAVFLAALLKWNKIAAAIGVQITNPLTAPIIYSFTYSIGAKLIGLQKTVVWKDAFDLSKIAELFEVAPAILTALTIGGIIVGLPVAIAGYVLGYSAVDNYQKNIKAKLLHQKDVLKQKIKAGKMKAKRDRK
jgi:uncharacterized protein (DUF2062 family)